MRSSLDSNRFRLIDVVSGKPEGDRVLVAMLALAVVINEEWWRGKAVSVGECAGTSREMYASVSLCGGLLWCEITACVQMLLDQVLSSDVTHHDRAYAANQTRAAYAPQAGTLHHQSVS
jgi:hypothetical protein